MPCLDSVITINASDDTEVQEGGHDPMLHCLQPALSYTAPELVKGAQQSNGGLFSAADVFSLGMHFPLLALPCSLTKVMNWP